MNRLERFRGMISRRYTWNSRNTQLRCSRERKTLRNHLNQFIRVVLRNSLVFAKINICEVKQRTPRRKHSAESKICGTTWRWLILSVSDTALTNTVRRRTPHWLTLPGITDKNGREGLRELIVILYIKLVQRIKKREWWYFLCTHHSLRAVWHCAESDSPLTNTARSGTLRGLTLHARSLAGINFVFAGLSSPVKGM